MPTPDDRSAQFIGRVQLGSDWWMPGQSLLCNQLTCSSHVAGCDPYSHVAPCSTALCQLVPPCGQVTREVTVPKLLYCWLRLLAEPFPNRAGPPSRSHPVASATPRPARARVCGGNLCPRWLWNYAMDEPYWHTGRV
jgi:hypothetical protein